MHKIKALCVAGVAALALTGCSFGAEADYLDALRAEGFTASDEVLLAQGHGVCTKLDNGTTLTELIFNTAVGSTWSGADPETAGTQIGAAVALLCPRHVPPGMQPSPERGGSTTT